MIINCDEFINTLSEIKSDDAALDFIYDFFDDFMYAKQFDLCGEILSKIDMNKSSLVVLFGLLTATLPAKSKIVKRGDFYHKVKDELIRRRETIDILNGLE